MLADYRYMAVRTLGAVQFWDLSETFGTSAANAVNPSNGITWGSNFVTTNAVVGPDGATKAAKNDGVSGHAGLTNSTFQMPATHTICYWIRLDTQTAADQMSIEWGDSSFSTNLVQHDVGYTGTVISGTANQFFPSAWYGNPSGAEGASCNRSLMTTGVWKFVAITLNPASATGMNIYIDGTDVSNRANLNSLSQTGYNPGSYKMGVMGRTVNGGNALNLNGGMSGLVIFNSILSNTQINNLRSAMLQSGAQQPFTSAGIG